MRLHLTPRVSLLSAAVLLLGMALSLAALPARGGEGGEVTLRTESGLMASAYYRQGEPGRKTVLLLHGLLQTRDFLTVASLTSSLADQGYTVLAPTLSLGVNLRRGSLACESIHAHTMEDDVSEIGQWVHWLESRGHNDIVLVGHSFGSVQLLAYLAAGPSASVSQLVAASLIDNQGGATQDSQRQVLEEATSLVQAGDVSLQHFPFSYCNQYVAPPQAYLSYARWTAQQILQTLKKVHLPVEVIVGGADKRMGEDWPETLRSNGVSVKVIDEAGHFFDAQYEFDLLEEIDQQLNPS